MSETLANIREGLLFLALFVLAIAVVVGALLAVVFGPWWAKTFVLAPLVLWASHAIGKDVRSAPCTCRHNLFIRYESQSCPKHGRKGRQR